MAGKNTRKKKWEEEEEEEEEEIISPLPLFTFPRPFLSPLNRHLEKE